MEEMTRVSIREITDFLRQSGFAFRVKGAQTVSIAGFSSLSNYKEDTVTWVKSEKNWSSEVENIALCVVQEGIDLPIENQIICRESKAVFFAIIERFFEEAQDGVPSVGKNTVLEGKVTLGKDVRIGSNCSISGNVTIGDGTIISDNVVIRNRVAIGARCTIQALSVIGEDGFGYSEDETGKKTMVRHHGGVVIGNDVFIGSHVNIARGTIDDTCIGDGVKIAPSTHIGHNNRIGKNAAVICSQSYGSVSIGENAYVVGSILRNQCTVGERALVGMGSVVTKDVEAGKVAIGSPAKVIRDNA